MDEISKMSKKERLKNNVYTIADILEYLDKFTSTGLVFVCRFIVDECVKDENVINKLFEISDKLDRGRSDHEVFLGYRVGHLAMSTLLKLGISEEEIFKQITLDDFDKELLFDFLDFTESDFWDYELNSETAKMSEKQNLSLLNCK